VLKLLERFDANAFWPIALFIAPCLMAFAVAFGTSGGIFDNWLNGKVVTDVGNE
jgi:hypothetical protein